jgi:hypothetical protein
LLTLIPTYFLIHLHDSVTRPSYDIKTEAWSAINL